MTSHTQLHGSGISGTLRLIAMALIIAFAVIAAGILLEVISMTALAAVSAKLIALGGIALATSVVIWALTRLR